jgi:maleate isomerase
MTTIDQRAAATARRIEETREMLVQDDVLALEPRPPAALLELYGVRAQVLAPIERDGALAGWLSVHDCSGPHDWSADEQAAINAAAKAVQDGWPIEPTSSGGRD